MNFEKVTPLQDAMKSAQKIIDDFKKRKAACDRNHIFFDDEHTLVLAEIIQWVLWKMQEDS